MSTPDRRIPRATYRLQVHGGFTLADAADLADYLADLGVSHAYTAPVLAAAPGSVHNYDVVDHGRVNDELGGEAALDRFCAALRERGLGWVLDIVPNHMAIETPANRAFWDVMKHGPTSAHAVLFDIDWDPPQAELKGRVMLPVLGRELDEVIDALEIQIAIEDGEPVLAYYEHRMPLAPQTAEGLDADAIAAVNADAAQLRALIDRQHYRPVFWRRACREINYRRFFTINSLIGLRVEDEGVFERSHALPFKWIREGRLDGLRIDHPDGLRDPVQYHRRLRAAAPDTWIVIEKILETDERLPTYWPIDGTTGYNSLNILNGLFVDAAAEAAMTQTYAEFTGHTETFDEVAMAGKRFVLTEDFGGELARLVELLGRIEPAAGVAPDRWRAALGELLVHWPVYRIYPDPETGRITDADRARVETAVRAAAAEHDALPAEAWALLGKLLALDVDGHWPADFALRFQQLATAVAAKGVEDTALYRYHRLVALNEVGGDPGRFGTSLARFHAHASRVSHTWPAAMVATTTHDTKRSEDCRLRIALLSQFPDRWAQTVARLAEFAAPHRADDDTPSCAHEYLLYQTLAGTWPIDTDRLTAYMIKAARESKTRTSWIEQNAEYEQRLAAFIGSVVADHAFTDALHDLLDGLVPAARVASLAQTLIKLTMPGVPDLYQGAELWDESLVDPDNRRPAPYDRCRAMLGHLHLLPAEQILDHMEDGAPKLWVVRQALAARRDHAECFAPGASYEPIPVDGPEADGVVAYRRAERIIVVAPRLTAGLDGWSADTTIALSAGHWRNTLTGDRLTVADGQRVSVLDLWRRFPVALLIQEGADDDA